MNGWTLQFPAGNYEIRGGNVIATINPVAGCYVKQTQSAAYAVTSSGSGSGSGITTEQYDALMAAIMSRSTLDLVDVVSAEFDSSAVVAQRLTGSASVSVPLTGG